MLEWLNNRREGLVRFIHRANKLRKAFRGNLFILNVRWDAARSRGRVCFFLQVQENELFLREGAELSEPVERAKGGDNDRGDGEIRNVEF